MSSNSGKFFGASWLVNDIDASMRYWTEVNGVGPFYIRRDLESPGLLHHGKVAPLKVHIAFAQAGPILISLIQQLSDGPSAYLDIYPDGREGFHHIIGYTDDLDADLQHYAEAGVGVASLGTDGATRFAYFDTSAAIGCMTELIDNHTSTELQAAYARIAAAAVDWDGQDPIRELSVSPEPVEP
jgi:hypothetical protein